MADALVTDLEIAVLCDFAGGTRRKSEGAQKERSRSASGKGARRARFPGRVARKIRLTGKAQHLLAERGVGISGG